MENKSNKWFQQKWFVASTVFVLAAAGIYAYIHRETQGINAPVPEADIAFTNFALDATKANVIGQATGTRLSIPANAFVDDSGKPVTGQVTFKVREFHETSDVLRAGIPMRVEAGSDDVLQSAGMIEFRAYQGEKQLALQEGKSIGIELASFRPAAGYDLYYLKDDSEWEVTDTFAQTTNERKQEKIDSLKAIVYQRCGIASQEEGITFELGGSLSGAPYLKSFAGIQWLLCPAESDPTYTTALREIWEAVKLEKPQPGDNLFSMTMSRVMFDGYGSAPKLRTFNAKALLATEECEGLPDWDKLIAKLEQADGELKDAIKRMEEYLIEMEEQSRRIRNEADLLSVFDANNLGVYNIDKILANNDEFVVNATFDFESNYAEEKLQKTTLYCIFETENAVVNVTYKDFKKLKLRSSTPVSFNILLPDGKIAVVHSDEVRKTLAGGKKIVQFQTTIVDGASYLKSKHSRANPV